MSESTPTLSATSKKISAEYQAYVTRQGVTMDLCVDLGYDAGKTVAYLRSALESLKMAQAMSNRITVPHRLGEIMGATTMVREAVEGLEAQDGDAN